MRKIKYGIVEWVEIKWTPSPLDYLLRNILHSFFVVLVIAFVYFICY